MHIRHFAFFTTVFFIHLFLPSCQPEVNEPDYDIVIYGGSSAGVIAAYSAVKKGKSVLLISPDKHLGGLSASGLGFTDIGNKYAVSGLSRDFYRRLGKHYDRLEAWTFEPSKAEEVFNDYIEEANVEVWYNYYLKSVMKEGTTIKQLTVFDWDTKEAKTISGRQFIDATYTGDLMAKAGVSYTVGREPNDQYSETLNGVQLRERHQFPPYDKQTFYISPYIVPDDPSSGLCYGISDEPVAADGTGDAKVQAYNYRLCLTQDTTNLVPFTQPDGYDPANYELLKRLIQEREKLGWKQTLDYFYLLINPLPNGKTDVNNKGAFSTDFIGMNYDYPEASYERRKEMDKEHADYIKGLLYFLSTSPDITDALREEMQTWGWAKDEFTDSDHFPWKLYIREARRMVGETVMTEHHCVGKEVVSDPIGLAAYTMDSHNTQRVIVERDGKMMVKNEGNVEVGGFPPYPIAYSSLTPQRADATNLLVPICLSASHIAYGSIRMEPVFMLMGQVAAMAAANAMDEGTSVQQIDVPKLQQELEKNPLLNGTLPEFTIDNGDSARWSSNQAFEERKFYGQYKSSVTIWNADDEVTLKVTNPDLSGTYELFYYIPRKRSGARKRPTNWVEELTFTYGERTFTVDVKEASAEWAYVGKIEVAEEKAEPVVVRAQQTGQLLVFDAMLWRPVKEL